MSRRRNQRAIEARLTALEGEAPWREPDSVLPEVLRWIKSGTLDLRAEESVQLCVVCASIALCGADELPQDPAATTALDLLRAYARGDEEPDILGTRSNEPPREPDPIPPSWQPFAQAVEEMLQRHPQPEPSVDLDDDLDLSFL